jgi:hypothetical protein
MAAFHARAEGRCRTVAHRRFLMMRREFGMTGFHKANSGPTPSANCMSMAVCPFLPPSTETLTLKGSSVHCRLCLADDVC